MGLGLKKTNRTVLLSDTPEVRGMIHKVIHLVSVEEV
jgi:large subunit ribosomal protein L30